MLQQVMTAPGEIEFIEVPVPEIADNEVLVKIEKIGICGSDVHVYHGKHPFTQYPVTQGHEASGYIQKLGKNVKNLKQGQKVTVEPQLVCGKCHPCRHGKYNLCEELKVMGFQAPGMAARFFATDASNITPLPDSFHLEDGAMIEPLAVAVHAVNRAGDVAGRDIVVIGAGPIGNLVAQTAKGKGARRVMITDISDFRLKIARDCGIDVCVNTNMDDFNDALLQVFGPDKADFIFDCAGTNLTMGQAIASARKGSTIILVAVFSDLATIDLALAGDHELTIASTMMYRHEDYEEAIRLVTDKLIKLRPLVTKHFTFLQYPQAYRFIEENPEKAMKVMINVQE
ncbi:MAG: alcohol dehydrogenase catalytic domain-containing protein [Clostridiales bacterium]|nr:alcohol dehydrogenase catalytic domain-containing protein [Clostridiales bacterium]